MQDVDICSAHATVGNLHFYLVLAARRLLNFQDVDVSISGSILDKSFHVLRDPSSSLDVSEFQEVDFTPLCHL
jgi:hypothetical protein